MTRFCFAAAVTMSLGWGLRGFIGGGPLGAMIPGAARDGRAADDARRADGSEGPARYHSDTTHDSNHGPNENNTAGARRGRERGH